MNENKGFYSGNSRANWNLEFGFCGGTKTGGPGEKSSEQGREPTIKLNLNVTPGLGMMSNHNDHNICDKTKQQNTWSPLLRPASNALQSSST